MTGDSPCPASRVRAHQKYVRSAKRPVSECSKVCTNFSNLYISIYGAWDIRELGSSVLRYGRDVHPTWVEGRVPCVILTSMRVSV